MNKYLISIKDANGNIHHFPAKGDEHSVRAWQQAGYTVSRELGKIPLWFFVEGRHISLKRKLRWLETLHTVWQRMALN